MQMMSWMVARLGSRFNLLFEPSRRRVMHAALGRLQDQPLDLSVGLIEPDGTERVLPFTAEGDLLANPEQFERINSVTYRGYSEKYSLQFEFNVHSVFYPQEDRLCSMPVFYLEMRVNPVDHVRWAKPVGDRPKKVKLFLRLRRPDTQITASSAADGQNARLDLTYQNNLLPMHSKGKSTPKMDLSHMDRTVPVHERIVSLNTECQVSSVGDGLECELPVSEQGSGIKWRLVWGAHVAEPILDVKRQGETHPATFRYTDYWKNVDEVLSEAIRTRDDRLALSRRFEKLLEQAPLDVADRHLLNQSFQNWLSNTFWCNVQGVERADREWFSVWEGACLYHSTVDVEYNVSLVYFSLWPRLLALQLNQWTEHTHHHSESNGRFVSHDIGHGPVAYGQTYPHAMPVEENSNYLLLLQAYTHWTGDRSLIKKHAPVVAELANYLKWTDRDNCGFPSEGLANAIDDAGPAMQFSRKQTYLAIKRACALRAAGDLLTMADMQDEARTFEDTAETDLRKIERDAWLGDHFAVCTDRSAAGVLDAWTEKPLPYEQMPGWDAYSIYTANGLLLPIIIGQPPALGEDRLRKDMISAARENLGRYGCGHTSIEPENVWVSQNLWRDIIAHYLKIPAHVSAQYYWDLQVMSNTGEQSLGYVDSYIGNNLSFYPRGIVSIGNLLSGPRLVIDRLAAGGVYITVDPDRNRPQRWPLLPLADWRAGKIPVCVVDERGQVTIEGKIDPVIVHGSDPTANTTDAGLIG